MEIEAVHVHLSHCLGVLTAKQQAILRAVHAKHPDAIEKVELAEISGASATSSTYTNNLGAMRSAGMIVYTADGVKCADWLFID